MILHLKTAIKSLWSNKIRSFLTVLGIVIGVSSVTSLVSLGKGMEEDVSSLIKGLGTNILVVIGGQLNIEDQQVMQQMNPANFIAGDILTTEDVEDLESLDEIDAVTPMTIVANTFIEYDEKKFSPMMMGAYPNLDQTMQVLEREHGELLRTKEDKNEIVIGPGLSKSLFGENSNPVGEKVLINKEEFEIIGKLAPPSTTSLFASEFDYIALVNYNTATRLNGGEESVFRIIAKADDDADVPAVSEAVHSTIKENHKDKEDFTVFTQDDLLEVFSTFLNMATALVSAIAAISLIVGGIGIMNIMLVTVTERTKEIGLRKAVGATKTAILLQFLTEAIIITVFGGLIGLAISIAGNIVIENYAPIKPVLSLGTIGIALGISIGIGIIFGIWPAMNAAKKDPIEALRHE